MITIEKLPKWVKELLSFTSIYQQFLIDGNIYDFYPYFNKKYGYVTQSLPNYLTAVLHQVGYENVILYEPCIGFTLLKGNHEQLQQEGIDFSNQKLAATCSLREASEIIEKILQTDQTNSAVIFNYASRIHTLYSQQEIDEFLYRFFRFSLNAYPIKTDDIPKFNLLLFILEQKEDFPPWYNHSKIRSLSIPKPDSETRKKIIRSVITSFKEFQTLLPQRQDEIVELLSVYTNTLDGKDILHCFMLAKQKYSHISQVFETIQEYKSGAIETLWNKKELLSNLRENLQKEIFGQDSAVEKVVKAFQCAFYDLYRLENPEAIDKPRLTYLFASSCKEIPKEIGKSLAKTVLNSESLLFLFNLSEYVQSDEPLKKLLHGEHGLIKIIQEYPSSIIMFENIEKVPLQIQNIVYQVVKNGRINIDKQMLYFTQAIVILTTSIEPPPVNDAKQSLEKITSDYYTAAKQQVQQHINSDLLDNCELILFGPIKKDDIQKWIQKKIEEVLVRIKNIQNITIILNDTAIQKIISECMKRYNPFSMQEVETCLHDILTHPLAEYLLQHNIQYGQTILIEKCEARNHWWHLHGTVA
ncbi:AAA family ATPase [Nitratiruptor sp. SB155-2]|uniref:AAA family ATPase n=1 Tax=Nitratiruptor sp. (strain SB155-2) TaxID=387092 RepID=UPI0001586D0F|nr:AAA family ATPase [Nitratiruptor sp. SB155-2]BAF69308.1 conserved hypothetical protein [Nitratiruptor sp. SB155-2]